MTDSTGFTEDLATELGRVVVSEVGALEERIRSDVEEKMKAEQDEKINDAVLDAVAEMGADVNRGYTDTSGGMLEFGTGDVTLATQASQLLDSRWKPLVVSSDSVDDSSIKQALTEFFAGGPLGSYAVGSDEDSAVLVQVMESCHQKAKIDPHAKSIISNLTNYTVGTGLEISCSVQEIEDELRSFASSNQLHSRIKQAVKSKFIHGEHYFFYYIDPSTGDVHLRDRTKPYDIRSIQTHPEDTETRLAYGKLMENDSVNRISFDTDRDSAKYDWYADIDYFEQKALPSGAVAKGTGRMSNRKLVQMVKMGAGSDVRGVPLMYPVLRYLKYYEDFITDRIILNHERSKVVWVRRISGNRKLAGGRAQRGPVGGQILTETPQVEWRVIKPEINADDVTEDGRLIRLAIASGVGMPEHLLFQDPSNQVYASIRSSDTPFAQSIRSYQFDWLKDLEIMFRVVLREKVKAGALPEKTEVETFTMESYDRLADEIGPMVRAKAPQSEIIHAVAQVGEEVPTETVSIDTVDVKIDLQFPEVVQQDPIRMAQESEILHRIGVLSKTEIAARHGFNFKQSAKLMSMERAWDTSNGEEDDSGGPETYGKGSDSNEPETDTEEEEE